MPICQKSFNATLFSHQKDLPFENLGYFFAHQQRYYYQCHSHAEKETSVGHWNNIPRTSFPGWTYRKNSVFQCLSVDSQQAKVTKLPPFWKCPSFSPRFYTLLERSCPFQVLRFIAWDLRKNTTYSPDWNPQSYQVSKLSNYLQSSEAMVFSKQKYILNDRFSPLRTLKMPGACLKVVIGNCSALTCHRALSLGLFLLHETEICSKQYIHWPLLFTLHCIVLQHRPRTLLCLQLFRGTGLIPTSKPHESCLATPVQQQHTRLDYKAACPLLTQAPSKSHTHLSTPATTGKTQSWAIQPQEATCSSRQGFGRCFLFALISTLLDMLECCHYSNIGEQPHLTSSPAKQPQDTNRLQEKAVFSVKGQHTLDRSFYYMTSEWSCDRSFRALTNTAY